MNYSARSLFAPKNSAFQLDVSYFKPLGSNSGMQVLPDGTVRLARHFSDRMEALFGKPRDPHAEITQRDMDLAFALQNRFEEIFFHLLNQLHRQVVHKCAPCDDLVMAGGCALNSGSQRQAVRPYTLSSYLLLSSPRRVTKRLGHRACASHLIIPFSSSLAAMH